MSWPDPTRSICIASTALALAVVATGCGFAPRYGERGARTDALAQVRIEQIADRTGQQLRNHLLLRLNPRGEPRNPSHVLKIKLAETRRWLGVRRDDAPTRANLRIQATYALERAGDGAPLARGKLSSTSSYNILDSQFGTLKAVASARSRAVRELSDALITRLALSLRSAR